MKAILPVSIGIFLLTLAYIWTQTLNDDQWLDMEAWIVLIGLGFIFLIAVTAFGVWCYAAYKWITRKKWQGKTPNGNPRI